MLPSVLDVAIIGAGPYGLSISAHLRARGVEHRVFGKPMHAWASMPAGMYLKSFDFATNIYTPQRHYTFREYCRANGLTSAEPVEIALFARYGAWVQQKLLPDVETVDVVNVARQGEGFALTLTTGERVSARRVVSAVGLTYFERVPEMYASLSPELVSHTAQQSDFSRYRGRDVTVIGAGQSALQAAALLHEHGAEVRLLARHSVWWTTKMPEKRSLYEQVKYPQTVLGPGRVNWVLQHAPWYAYHIPDEKRIPFVHRHLGPAGAWWLKDRVEGKVAIHNWTTVQEAREQGGKVRLRVTNPELGEREIETDHVITGTGFAVDVENINFLDAALLSEIRRVEHAPALSTRFESSVPGLYFVGPASALNFGPLFRFVAGADYTAPTLARHLVATGRRLPAWRAPAPKADAELALTMPQGRASL